MSAKFTTIFEESEAITLDAKLDLFRTGDRVRWLYLVADGQVELIRHSSSGTPMILTRVGRGDVIAEASAYSDVYHCDGVTKTRSHLQRLPVSRFRELLRSSPELAESWAAELARSLQKARMQSEIRTLKTVAERLDAWLMDNRELPRKGQMQDLAHVLGVSREALYRELAKRRN